MTALQTNESEQVWLMPVFTPKPGQESALRAALGALQKVSRKDPGCIEYAPYADGRRFVLIEGWERQAHLDAHNGQAHVLDFVKLAPSLLAEPFTITPITPVG